MEQFLETRKVLLLDGGLSNELNNRVSFDVHKEKLWTAKAISTHPEAMIATHLAYLEGIHALNYFSDKTFNKTCVLAGADIIETSSYQATLEGFEKFMNVDPEGARKCIQDSVTLAKSAVEKFEASKDIGM